MFPGVISEENLNEIMNLDEIRLYPSDDSSDLEGVVISQNDSEKITSSVKKSHNNDPKPIILPNEKVFESQKRFHDTILNPLDSHMNSFDSISKASPCRESNHTNNRPNLTKPQRLNTQSNKNSLKEGLGLFRPNRNRTLNDSNLTTDTQWESLRFDLIDAYHIAKWVKTVTVELNKSQRSSFIDKLNNYRNVNNLKSNPSQDFMSSLSIDTFRGLLAKVCECNLIPFSLDLLGSNGRNDVNDEYFYLIQLLADRVLDVLIHNNESLSYMNFSLLLVALWVYIMIKYIYYDNNIKKYIYICFLFLI
jgi:hypothetical protein